MRWIWIDKFLEFRSGKFARAIKNLTLAEEHLHDHLPGYPVMPASLIIEGLAQTGGILVGEAHGFKFNVILAKINSARFTREALPGEQLIYEVEVVNLRTEGAVVQGTVRAARPGQAREQAEAIGQAEIFFAHLDPARAPQGVPRENFVFSGALQRLLSDFLPAPARAPEEGDRPPEATA